MQKNHLGKILAVGIICLFIGVGIHPAFAFQDKTSIPEYEIPTNTDGEVLENTNCLVIGMSSNSCVFSDFATLLPIMSGEIGFGIWMPLYCNDSAEGWIYTDNFENKWEYRGFFKGVYREKKVLLDAGEYAYFKIGIKGFRGLIFGRELTFNIIYFGFADSVKIITCDS
jgi:hypothetical protein